jgi:hypothetical protein
VGERLPRDAPGALYTHISRLRRALRPVANEIVRRGGGYLLDLEPDQVDLARCRRLAAEARSHAAAGPDGASRALELLLFGREEQLQWLTARLSAPARWALLA